MLLKNNSRYCFQNSDFENCLFSKKIQICSTLSLMVTPLNSTLMKLPKSQTLHFQNLTDHFLRMGLNCLKATEPLQGGTLLFTTKFPEIPGTHLILQPPSGFEHRTLGLGVQCLNHLAIAPIALATLTKLLSLKTC